MNKLIDLNKEWIFIYPDITPLEYSVTPKQKEDGAVVFYIPYGSEPGIGMEITLHSIIEVNHEKKINATYHDSSSSQKGEITFQILEQGRLLQGTPQDWHGSHHFKLILKDEPGKSKEQKSRKTHCLLL